MPVPVLMVPSLQIVAIDVLSPKDTLIVCEEALKLWQTGDYEILLTSAGLFLPPEKQTRPAATLMAEWFIERGVPAERIIAEAHSLDTYENLSLSLATLEERGIDADITVCTHWTQAERIRHTFKVAHARIVHVHGISFPFSAAEWIYQWACIAYHYMDRDGSGWLARRIRFKRDLQTRAPKDGALRTPRENSWFDRLGL